MDSGKENTEPAPKMGLARMFHEGNRAIGTHKTDDLFKQLESRSLTDQEEAIIQQRMELQRKMLLAYEAREKTRKIQYLQQLCPDLTEEEAQRALDLCNGREEAAAEQVVSDPAFRRRLQIATTSASTHAQTYVPTTKRTNKWNAKPSTRRPKQVDTASLGSSVFVGSFRGGKRGGSRTAHLKAASAQPCKSQTQASTKALQADPSHDSPPAPSDPTSSHHPHAAALDSSTGWADDSDAVISESEAEGEEVAQDVQQHMNSSDQPEDEELKFEVDVVDTLGDLSQPSALSGDVVDAQQPLPGSSSQMQGSQEQNTVKGGRLMPAEVEAASPSRAGTRQSRRLAALAERQGSHNTGMGAQVAQDVHGTRHENEVADAAAQHKGNAAQRGQQQQSAPQLSQAVLEASANTLRTLTVPRAVLFLHNTQPSAREGTWQLLQAMDAAKATELEAAMHDADAASAQTDASLPNIPLALAPAESAPGQSHVQSGIGSTGHLPHLASTAAASHGTASTENFRVSNQAPHKPITDTHMDELSAAAEARVGPKGRDAALQRLASSKDNAETSASASVVEPSSAAASKRERGVEQGLSANPQAGSGMSNERSRLESDAQHSVSPAGVQGVDKHPLSKGKADSTAGKGTEAQQADAEPSSSKPAATGQAKRAWKSKNASLRKSQQVTLDRAFAKQASKEAAKTQQQQQHAGDCGADQRQRRSTRAKAVSAEVAASAALISESELEEQTESDTEFMAGTKRRGRASLQSSPAKKRKTAAVPKSSADQAPSSSHNQNKSKHKAASLEGVKRKRQTSQEEHDVPLGSPISPRPAPNSPGAVRRSPRAVKKSARALESEATLIEEEKATALPQAKGTSGQGRKGGRPSGGNCAIARSGHTNRGRVKQKSHKAAHILEVGAVRAEKGWFNSGYIFPEGFKSQLPFRSSVDIDQLCLHECTIIGRGGEFWPQPTYKVVAMDRPDEPLVGKSCTSCWTQVLKRINSEIQARRQAGENLPPPPKTAIAGPEYFGLNQPELAEQIEALDPEQQCSDYWLGKADREAAAAGLPPAERAPRNAPRPLGGTTALPKAKRCQRNRQGSEHEAEAANEEEDEDESNHMTNRWSAVSRTERYRKRCGDEGSAAVDESNPLPDYLDPILLEPVVTPAISPWGHVMGLATWKAVLAEQGKCPFTKNSLSWEKCTTLTLSNIDRYRGRMKSIH